MFITKGTLYLLAFSLTGIAGFIFIGFSLAKSKTKKSLFRKWSLLIGIILLIVSGYTGINLALKTYSKITTTISTLQKFPETVETESNKDTTDYTRILKTYEPEKYNGKVPESFYTEYGFYDWWRFPMVYPYSINCIDVLDKGVIVNDSGKTDFENEGLLNSVSPYFDKFIFDKNYIAGNTVPAPGTKENGGEYFIFNFQNGKLEKIKDMDSLMKKLDELGFTNIREFISIRIYGQRF